MEFAIVMPLLFLLLLGILDFGIAFNDYQSIRQGARDGARQTVVQDYGTNESCGINGSATTAPANAKRIICTTKARTGLGNDVRVGIRVLDNAPTGAPENDSVRVCTIRMARSTSGLMKPFLDGRPLRTTVEMRIEKNIGLMAGSYLETDPSAGGWTWC